MLPRSPGGGEAAGAEALAAFFFSRRADGPRVGRHRRVRYASAVGIVGRGAVIVGVVALLGAVASGCLIYDESLLEEDDGGGGTGGAGGGTGGGGAGGGGGCQGVCQHLLISELVVTPTSAEFIEIFNPLAEDAALDDVYLADFSGYHAVAGGSPMVGGTDFLVRFPPGSLPGGERVVVAVDSVGFIGEFGTMPDYVLSDMQGTVTPGSGGSGLANNGEMLILFSWDGASATVSDLDYVRWGTAPDSVDKSQVAGYQPDTPVDSQSILATPNGSTSQQRCNNDEPGEAKEGGNGVIGHDETSEDLASAFAIGTPSPRTSPGAGVCP